jgi:hypothetical protein
MYTARFNEMHCPLDELHADVWQPAVYDTGYNSLQLYHRAAVILFVGDIQAGGTVDLDIEQATDTGGTGAKAIAGKSITQLTAADSNCSPVIVNIRTEELDVDGGFDCINAELTVANAAAELHLVIFGCEPRYPPVADSNWDEVVA